MYLTSSAKTIMHRLDPRTKVMSIFIITVTSILLNNHLTLTLLCSITALFLIFSGNIRPLIFLIAITSFTWCFTVFLLFLIGADGKTSMESLKFFLRILAIANMGFLLPYTTSTNTLIKGLEKLKVPSSVILMLILTYRFIPIFTEVGKDIVSSLRIRGLTLKSFLKEPSLLSRGIAIPLIVSMVRFSRDLAAALEARAFGNHIERTSFKDIKLRMIDGFFIAGLASLSSILLMLQGLCL